LTDLDAAGAAKEYSAEELMNHGLALNIAETPGATVVTYQRIQDEK